MKKKQKKKQSPNTKPIAVGTIYRPPSQTNFMEIFNENLSKVDTNSVETYIFGDFNISFWQNDHYIFEKRNFLSCQSVANDVKNYFDFCTMLDLKQLIESLTHILASFPYRVTQREILNVRLFDHQLIYCTRKITRIKRGNHKQITIPTIPMMVMKTLWLKLIFLSIKTLIM